MDGLRANASKQSYTGGRTSLDRDLGSLPRVISTETPYMTFQVVTTKTSPTVVFIFNFDDHFRARSFRPNIDSICVGYDHVSRLRFRAADFIGLFDQTSPLGFLLKNRPEHDHAVTKGQLRMGNRAVIIRVDRLFLEPKRCA